MELHPRPILFSAPMVRAIIAGTKTQTRRLVKQPPRWRGRYDLLSTDVVGPDEVWWWDGVHDRTGASQQCPYGKAKDGLWVRETWQYAGWTEDGYPIIEYAADNARVLHEKYPEEWVERLEDTWAALSAEENYKIDNRAADRRWRPGIHLPRWAGRVFLRVTAVRAERLQDITREDEIAEGTPDGMFFDALWDSINEKRAPWSSNPWVWVVQFERV